MYLCALIIDAKEKVELVHSLDKSKMKWDISLFAFILYIVPNNKYE